MRRTTIVVSALAVAALLAAAGSPASAAPTSDPFGRAVAQVRAHAASTHFEQGQTFTLKNVIMDPDGAEHVRLHRLGFSVQVPKHRAVERDEQAIALWRREAWPAGKR